MDPVVALRRIAYLLEAAGEPVYRSRSFSRAAKAVEEMTTADLEGLAARGGLQQLAGIGAVMERVITEALRGEKPVAISTTCTVFAESEVLAWLARGKKIEDILAGVHRSTVSRAMGLMRRVGIEREVTFTGGVSRNTGIVAALNEAVGFPVNVSEESHFMGALGAALFAMDHIQGKLRPAAPREAPDGIKVQ